MAIHPIVSEIFKEVDQTSDQHSHPWSHADGVAKNEMLQHFLHLKNNFPQEDPLLHPRSDYQIESGGSLIVLLAERKRVIHAKRHLTPPFYPR